MRTLAGMLMAAGMLVTAPAGAQTTRPFTHEAMIATKRLGAVAPSPDGRPAVIQNLN